MVPITQEQLDRLDLSIAQVAMDRLLAEVAERGDSVMHVDSELDYAAASLDSAKVVLTIHFDTDAARTIRVNVAKGGQAALRFFFSGGDMAMSDVEAVYVPDGAIADALRSAFLARERRTMFKIVK